MHIASKMFKPNRAKQQGAMMLITVTLLLLLTSTIIVYSARVSLVKHRVSLNTQNKVTAENMAALGNFRLLSQISQQPQQELPKLNMLIEGQGQYSAEMKSLQTERFSHQMRVIKISTTGTSEDHLANIEVSQHIIAYPLIRSLPKAALIVGKSISIENKLKLIANPNGAGIGLPLSLWTSDKIDITTLDLITCQLYEYINGECESSPLSKGQQKNGDIVDNPKDFPKDIFAYLTNLPVKYRTQLLDEADKVISHCEDLNNLSSGLIWVKGDCKLSKETTVGTTERPVMLIIANGNLVFSENSGVQGIVLMLKPFDSILAAHIEVNGPALIEGALIASESISFNNLPLTIKYDAVVLDNFRQSPSNWRIALVPNSWRNF